MSGSPSMSRATITFDLHIPLLSLPGLLNITEENCPKDRALCLSRSRQGGVLEAANRCNRAGSRSASVGKAAPRFGATSCGRFRSNTSPPIANLPNVTLVNLQKNHGAEQLEELKSQVPVVILDGLDESGGAFMDTAAVMQHLDLIIACDTSIAHLAGALGRPVWLPLSTGADWRWLRNRNDSPWYPTMRLFRQKTLGDWDSVFAEMAAELKTQLASAAPKLYGPTQEKPETATNPTSSVPVEIAPGELIDKITILEIKQERITDREKLDHVRTELEILHQCRQRHLPQSAELEALTVSLKEVNLKTLGHRR